MTENGHASRSWVGPLQYSANPVTQHIVNNSSLHISFKTLCKEHIEDHFQLTKQNVIAGAYPGGGYRGSRSPLLLADIYFKIISNIKKSINIVFKRSVHVSSIVSVKENVYRNSRQRCMIGLIKEGI